ncbi:hypothetical protein M8C21_012486, partial [Ambrosia artemisiifolia]
MMKQMAVDDATMDDPLLPHLWSIKGALDKLDLWKKQNEEKQEEERNVYELVSQCIQSFKHHPLYRNDIRFLKIWLLYMDLSGDHAAVFNEIQLLNICLDKALLYESYALLLEAMGLMSQANAVYQSGISRNAQPFGRLNNAHQSFLHRMHTIVAACQQLPNMDGENGYVNPWSISVIKNLLQKMNAQLSKYQGYHATSKSYSGK